MLRKCVVVICFLALPAASTGARHCIVVWNRDRRARRRRAGARITITNAATSVSRSVVTDNSGGFVFSLLPVGAYNLTIEQAGFRKYERRNILLQANENIRVDVGLEVGNVTEAVTVTASAAQVDTSLRDAQSHRRLQTHRRTAPERPQPGRPRAAGPRSDAGRGNNTAIMGGSAWRPKGQKEITVNGSRNNNLRYTLDGGTNMDDLVNDNLDFPFPDAVQEFSAQTSNMGVEQGGLSGGALNVVTKSGTNSHPRRCVLVRPQHRAECQQLLLARSRTS